MSNRKHNLKRRGIASVEFALILPFIMILTMGFIEMGNMFSTWMSVQKAAQSGARFASTGIGDEEGNRLDLIVAETERWFSRGSEEGTKIIVKSWPTAVAEGDGIANDPGSPCGLVEVDVIHDYHPVTPIVGALFPDVIKLTGNDRKLNEPWKPCDG
jgi:hypothetical protein